MYSTAEITALGMDCLAKNLGVVNMEYFIKVVKRESFDYTKWRRNLIDGMDDADLNNRMNEFCKSHVYDGNATVI